MRSPINGHGMDFSWVPFTLNSTQSILESKKECGADGNNSWFTKLANGSDKIVCMSRWQLIHLSQHLTLLQNDFSLKSFIKCFEFQLGVYWMFVPHGWYHKTCCQKTQTHCQNIVKWHAECLWSSILDAISCGVLQEKKGQPQRPYPMSITLVSQVADTLLTG